ncbi:Stress responsive A/B Barrel Domain [Andreprevotia lacus DSM 23236]|jgi:hypothetical protein|uniref:Stress responsive A/B Barrel Domain n=1 Tax=Andreprevotia lacus DSM 23236 TaxID=1121001 RepID=A0A1W1XZ48_9NEIS|nr:Dabb family protein [Andreprevotia lacus]SMC29240.1 Stress responsive A/B Barrel Domain [Andreprevotia lacus DSM 23236]
MLLRHIVLFAFKPGVAGADIASAVQAFCALPGAIPGIAAFEHGENVSPEPLNDGLTHAFTLSFFSEAGRDAYLVHPVHTAFVEHVNPLLAKAVIVDYWVS